jgi:hypothetical protein
MKDNFALVILSYLKDQEVEIYCGDSGETHQFSETEMTQKNIIRGHVIEAKGDCLVVRVVKNNKHATVYINAWKIKTVVAVEDPLFIMDIYQDETTSIQGKK